MIKSTFLFLLLIASLFISCSPLPPAKAKKISVSEPIIEKKNYAIALHGGAGTILKKNMTPEKEKAYLDVLNKALRVFSWIIQFHIKKSRMSSFPKLSGH